MVEPDLLQIRAGNREPWKVLVISTLLCRTRWTQVEPLLPELFRRWPDPVAMSRSPGRELAQLLRPLGLNNTRANTLRRMSAAYVDGAPVDGLPGVGKYVSDAYRLIVLRDRTCAPEDRKLSEYAEWLRAEAAP